jgi:hypothetical protein
MPKNPTFGYILEGLGSDILVYVFNGHLAYFEVIWYILEGLGIYIPVCFTVILHILKCFGIFMVLCYIFPPLWYFVPRQIWQPWNRRNVTFVKIIKSTFLFFGGKGNLLTLASKWVSAVTRVCGGKINFWGVDFSNKSFRNYHAWKFRAITILPALKSAKNRPLDFFFRSTSFRPPNQSGFFLILASPY